MNLALGPRRESKSSFLRTDRMLYRRDDACISLSRVVSARKNLGQIYAVNLGSCWELCFKMFPSFRETISTECIIRILGLYSPPSVQVVLNLFMVED